MCCFIRLYKGLRGNNNVYVISFHLIPVSSMFMCAMCASIYDDPKKRGKCIYVCVELYIYITCM